MDDKPFVDELKEGLKEFRQGFDKNSAATGVVAGVLVTLGLGALLPETTRIFVEEARGRVHRRHLRTIDRARPEGEKQLAADLLKEEADSFTSKLKSARTAADTEVKR